MERLTGMALMMTGEAQLPEQVRSEVQLRERETNLASLRRAPFHCSNCSW